MRVPALPAAAPLLLAATAALLTGCGSGGAAPAATVTVTAPTGVPTATGATTAATATTSAATTAATATATGTGASPGTSSGRGCPAGGTVPAGASLRATGDLDHDGAPDQLWLADTGGQRLLGVRTASGATFSTAYTSASPQGTTAIGAELSPSLSVVLLSDGRQVPLYAVVDCQLVQTRNAQGQQYTFDLGFTGYGSGVTCVPLGGGGASGDLGLYGLLVRGGEVEGDLATIDRTRIELSDGGRRAANGPTEADVVAGVAPDGPQAQAARQVRCGDQGPDTAVAEPAS